MNSRSDPPRAGRVPLALVPLVVYLGVTLLAPALHGAGRQVGFREHAAITLGVVGLLGWPWLVAGWRSSHPAARAARHPGHAQDPASGPGCNGRNGSG